MGQYCGQSRIVSALDFDGRVLYRLVVLVVPGSEHSQTTDREIVDRAAHADHHVHVVAIAHVVALEILEAQHFNFAVSRDRHHRHAPELGNAALHIGPLAHQGVDLVFLKIISFQQQHTVRD